MKKLVLLLSFMSGVQAYAQENHMIKFESQFGVKSLWIGALNVATQGDISTGTEEYLMKGLMLTNPFLQSFAMTQEGSMQRLLFGVKPGQSVDQVAGLISSAICKQMTFSKEFSAANYKTTVVDLKKDEVNKAIFSKKTYPNTIFVSLNSNKTGNNLSLKMYKEIKDESIYGLSEITCVSK